MSTRRKLTTTQMRELERELRSERARLERAMLADGGVVGDGIPASVALRAPANVDGGVAVALETRAVGRHQALVDALRRIEDGSYGGCMSCGLPIPYGRLLAMPETTRCVGCADRI